MESPMSAWFKPTTARIVWMLVGVLLTVFAFWSYRMYGKEVAYRKYRRAIREKPADGEAVDRIFAGAKTMIANSSREHTQVRYRFAAGQDIDVEYDADWNVIRIHPTFTQDGFGLTLLLHRRELITVPVKIPANDDEREGE